MIRQRLIDLRRTQDHTQESLAELVGVDRQQVWRWENGRTSPTSETLVLLANALNTSIDYLMGVTSDPTPQIRIENLSAEERAILAAMRRGDRMKAITLIASGAPA